MARTLRQLQDPAADRSFTVVSRNGARVWASSSATSAVLTFGPPRRGCGGLDHVSLKIAALDASFAMVFRFRAEGIRADYIARKRSTEPIALHIPDGVDVEDVARAAAASFDYFAERRRSSLSIPLPQARAVSTEEVVAEARRQEAFQLPRRTGFLAGQTQEQAFRLARATTRDLKEFGDGGGGYVLVDVPLRWIDIAFSHVDEDRQARMDAIGGTDDPAFSYRWGIATQVHPREPGNESGPVLSLYNGNNRAFYARRTGRRTFPVYVVRSTWEQFARAVRDARRSANVRPCASAPSADRRRKNGARELADTARPPALQRGAEAILARLWALPDADGAPGDVALPAWLPYDRAARFPPGKRASGAWDAYRLGERVVPVRSLRVWQETVDRQGVEWFVVHADHEPVVVVRQRDGRPVVADGHHRLMAAIMRGESSVRIDEYEAPA